MQPHNGYWLVFGSGVIVAIVLMVVNRVRFTKMHALLCRFIFGHRMSWTDTGYAGWQDMECARCGRKGQYLSGRDLRVWL